MQGLESKRHQNMLRTIELFEELKLTFGDIVSEDCKETILTNIAEFKKTHGCYNILLHELEDCIKSYNETHDSLRRNLYPYVRKVNTQARNKK